jgi:dihydrolipoamide dehydrogenase
MVVGELIYETDVLVLGGGPGGYTAAIHAADLGKEVMLVESSPRLGGVCLTEGCIPSKTLIHVVSLANTVKEAGSMGLVHKGIEFDVPTLGRYIHSVVKTLSSGVERLVENRDIEVIRGHARFIDKDRVYVDGANTIIRFNHAVIATGSRINELPAALELSGTKALPGAKESPGVKASPGAKESPVWTSAKALEVTEIPESLLVIGGGYIGLEIGQAYAGLGSRVSLVEFGPKLLSGADKDLVDVVVRQCEKQFAAIHTDSQVKRIEPVPAGFRVEIETRNTTFEQTFGRVLAATGRRPNTDDMGLGVLDLKMDEKGLILTDDHCRTSQSRIFAVGDVAQGPALAHKAAREGKVAAEVIAGQLSAFDNVAVPAVLFTSPEIAWTGLTEDDARARGIPVTLGKFPLTALGRARSVGKLQGFVKIIAQPDTQLVLGVGIVGEHASELIAEGTLAIEMGACLEDLIVSIHPHPTFSESIMEAAEMAQNGSVHLTRKAR